MLILALDFGASLGWAVADGPSVIDSGARYLGGDVARSYAALRLWIAGDIGASTARAELIAYEAVPASVHRGGIAAHRWGGYEAIVLAECAERKIPYLGVPIQAWKSVANVRTNSGPAAALRAAQRRWPDVDFTTADEAVARFVAIAAAERVK